MKKEGAIIIFQKKPERGKVKTRLAKIIGEEKAVSVYQYLLDQTHQQVSLLHSPAFVFFEREVEPEFLRKKNYHSAIQCQGDLGKKMKTAFQEVFDQGYPKAIIIGTDCKDLEAEILSGAINSLETHDVVIGPATDGGYYLLGMKKIHQPLFENKEWSSSTVFSDTMDDIKNLGLSIYVLKELSDVDIYEDMGDDLKAILGID